MDRGFSGNEHSLLDNIRSVSDETWDAVPQGGRRSAREIARHVGLFKYMYANHGFRGGDMGYLPSDFGYNLSHCWERTFYVCVYWWL